MNIQKAKQILEQVQVEREQVAIKVSNHLTTGEERMKLIIRLNELWGIEREMERQLQ